jgi:hypothetical protein
MITGMNGREENRAWEVIGALGVVLGVYHISIMRGDF